MSPDCDSQINRVQKKSYKCGNCGGVKIWVTVFLRYAPLFAIKVQSCQQLATLGAYVQLFFFICVHQYSLSYVAKINDAIFSLLIKKIYIYTCLRNHIVLTVAQNSIAGKSDKVIKTRVRQYPHYALAASHR